MIVFRQVDARFPCLWGDAAQPAGRWHAEGEGPVHYFADTPDGAWAEFLRHEEITELDDLRTIERQMWAAEIDDVPQTTVDLPLSVLTGGRETYPPCQQEARRLRAIGVRGFLATTAALMPGGARGVCINGGPQLGPPKTGMVIVIMRPSTRLIGWIAAAAATPPDDLLARVHHYVDEPAQDRRARPRSRRRRLDAIKGHRRQSPAT
jgi:hypothetical protein